MFKILLAFSALADLEIQQIGDTKALEILLELLERQDIFILSKKDGPMFYALVKHFRLSIPHLAYDRLDKLDPQTVCQVLIQWRLLQIKLQEYMQKTNLKKITAGSQIKPTKTEQLIQIEYKE